MTDYGIYELFAGRQAALLSGFILGIAAAFGAAIGSFLNVVVYRLPLGLSLSHPGSHCPKCGRSIRWRDNVPVFGWLLLRGRCRDCRAPISKRYPAVEALVAALFAGFAWLEIVCEGINLPSRSVATVEPGVPVADADLAFLAIRFAAHMLLATTLLAAALMARDGSRAPLRLWAPALLLGFALPLGWPLIRPEALAPSIEARLWEVNMPPAIVASVIGLVEGLCGLAVGLSLGALGPIGERHLVGDWPAKLGERVRSNGLALGLVGLFLGVQAVCWVAIASWLVHAVLARLVSPRWPGGIRPTIHVLPMAPDRAPSAILTAVIALLLAWRWIARAQAASAVPLAAGLLLTLLALAAVHIVAGRKTSMPRNTLE